MKRLFIALALVLFGCFLVPEAAFSGTIPPAPKWNGPPCQGYAVCSIDPPDPHNFFAAPCYISIAPNPKVNALILSSVGFCQAARAMLIVPAQERDNAYATLIYWYAKYVAQLKIPRGGTSQTMALQLFVGDMQDFQNNWQIYKTEPSAATWLTIENALVNFGSFAQILV